MAPRGKKTRVKNVAKKINSIADVAGDLKQNAETVSPFLPGKDISKNYFRRIPIEVCYILDDSEVTPGTDTFAWHRYVK